jgi:hypothetical protein
VKAIRLPESLCGQDSKGQSFTSSPLVLDHRRLPGFPSRQHVILEPEHFGSLKIAVDLKPNLPTEMMRPQLADGGEWLLPAGPADAKQIAEVRGLRVQVRALPGGSHAVGLLPRSRVSTNQNIARSARTYAVADTRMRPLDVLIQELSIIA